jgi:DNA-binding transcriptional ArsR family regulator
MKAIKNQTKQTILVYLLIYNELTLDQLSQLLKKSKSTIHHHMKQLLELNLITEESKPGSKTIYYKVGKFRSDVTYKQTYNPDIVASLPVEMQIERLMDLLEHKYAITLLMQNIIKLNLDRIKQMHSDYNETNQTLAVMEKTQEQFMAIYLATSEYASDFKKEITELISKYYEKGTELKDAVRPTAFMILGMNVKEVLDRKINDK